MLFLRGNPKKERTRIVLYYILRPLARAALSVYFRKIYLTGLENLPQGKPVILASNHPTAFVEPCILAGWIRDRRLYFLARGDFYLKSPFMARLYKWLGIIPVFRLKDGGYQHLKDNFSSFEACFDALHEGKTILILAEGGASFEKRLRPLRKGTARIVYGTLKKYGELDIQIVPVGVTYTQADRFRSEALLDIGKPIPARRFYPALKRNPIEGMKKITQLLEMEMRLRVLHIQNPEDDELTERLLEMFRNDRPQRWWPFRSADKGRLSMEQGVVERINAMPHPEKERLRKRVDLYFKSLQELGINDFGLMHPGYLNWKNCAFLALGWVPYLIGYALNILPLWVARWLGFGVVREKTFQPPVAITAGLMAYLIYWLLLLTAALLSGEPLLALGVGALPFLGLYALYYRELWSKWRWAWWADAIPEEEERKLRTLRAEILEMVRGGEPSLLHSQAVKGK